MSSYLEEYVVETIKRLEKPGLLLVSANMEGESNVMTIGWGLIGPFWSMPVFMIAVRLSRYTHGFIEERSEFTVNVPKRALRGKPVEGRGIMYTTVLVESGTYGIVRHPQFLGVVLMVCASILVSQHWLFVLIGVPLIVSMSKWIQEAEEHLIAKFGDDYRRYMEKVPRMNLVLGVIRLLQRRKREVKVDR